MSKNGTSVVEAVALWNEIVAHAGTTKLSEIKQYDYRIPYDLAKRVEDLWFDWFCPDRELFHRGVSLLKRLASIAESKRFDSKDCYVIFKNNWACNGAMWDDFRICNDTLITPLYTVSYKELWGAENGFAEPICKGTSNIRRFFSSEE